MNTLIINTAKSKEIVVALDKKGEYLEKKANFEANNAQQVLPLIDELLSENKVGLHEINAIKVERGPGSFTGLRVGISIANTLGTTLQIPINGSPIGVIVEPVYE